MSKATRRVSNLSKFRLPSTERATPEEIERRRELYSRVMRLREEIGPIGIATDELVRQARLEQDESTH